MLLLPSVSKACILSSNTLNFYTLPELSPAFPQLKPLSCGWVGGVDLNRSNDEDEEGEEEEEGSAGEGVSIMMCLRNKIRLVNIGETAAVKERDIEFGGCLSTVRRGNIACVADSRSYALVDVVAQQKIPLLPISSLDDQSAETQQQQAGSGAVLGREHAQEDTWPTSGSGHSRSSSVVGPKERFASQERQGHGRSSSLGIFRTESPGLGDSPRNSMVGARHGFDVPSIFQRQTSPRPTEERRASLGPDVAKPLPAPPPAERSERERVATPVLQQRQPMLLRPVIASPNDSEFLLVTGTGTSEPGLGMFVNLDGEIVRGTMEFSSFPESMVTDGKGVDLSVSMSAAAGGGGGGVEMETPEEGYVLAVVKRERDGVVGRDVEIQRWDLDPSVGGSLRQWLGIDFDVEGEGESLGIRRIVKAVEFQLPEVVDLLAQKAIRLPTLSGGGDEHEPGKHDEDASSTSEKVAKREKEERAYYSRMSHTRTSILTWTSTSIHYTLRNPLVLRLDAQLHLAQFPSPTSPSTSTSTSRTQQISPQRTPIERLLNELRGQRSTTELEFYTLAYIRQKAALLLWIDLVLQTQRRTLAFERDKRATEDALVESEIDPRFVVGFLPRIGREVLVGREGVWVQGGIGALLVKFLGEWKGFEVGKNDDPAGPVTENLLKPAKRFLQTWRRKRGNPSVVDGEHVFPTIDASLLLILLTLDASSPPGPAQPASVRAELNALVDSGVECFDRAVELLEGWGRLYVLSRLWQSKKNSAKVLETWRRILSGERDAGGEFTPQGRMEEGEREMKNYLTKLRNRNLVEEYATWLANRNPRLGVQVFADEGSRTSWSMSEVLAILRGKAPKAVKVYLEYLVFSKKQTQHIHELINYYLEIVVAALRDPELDAKNKLREGYETYRALRPPKPTYRQFIEENSGREEWSEARLRLLQLLGETGAEGGGVGYDVEEVVGKLEGWGEALVPEMIVLNGRRGKHEDAIRALTMGLGDFDMAVSYCLRGGYSSTEASISTSPSLTKAAQSDLDREQQRKKLFHTLLLSLLSLPDLTQRIERTAELLERFSSFFEISQVLELVPEGWSVEIVGPFLVKALGRLVRERNEGRVVRALYGSESLRMGVQRIECVEKMKPIVETGRRDPTTGTV